MSFPRYPKYKDSGVEWLGDLPDHWEVKRLKRVCDVFPSNVDKKSHDGQIPVLLCNYTDVYRNDVITAGMDFMEATASPEQIAKFTLRAGDTVITKDSETADDIAVAAHVPNDLPGVVCGYHLSIVRPIRTTNGVFVSWFFGSIYAKSRFAVLANGLTRVGLGQHELDSVELPFPPRREQAAVGAFLRQETEKFDLLVAAQRRLMDLLKEKRQAVISHAVTKGLNPDTAMKPSGIEWLGEVPAHWRRDRLRSLFRQEKRQDRLGEQVLSVYRDYGVIPKSSRDDNMNQTPLDLSVYQLVTPGDLVVNKMKCWQGSLGISNHRGITSPDYLVLAPHHHESSAFLNLLLRSQRMVSVYFSLSTGVRPAQWRIEADAFLDLPVLLPPKSEQEEIVAFAETHSGRSDRLIVESERAIELLSERRTALISAAVTGQIDVRQLAAAETTNSARG